jgi:hypothetical protein
MQLAGNLWPEDINRQDRSLRRKLKEMHVAIEIERKYPKDKVLELYLNQINLGNRAYGVEAASQRYFGKSVRDVNVAEAAMLAALPKAPERYNPRKHPNYAVQRRNVRVKAPRVRAPRYQMGLARVGAQRERARVQVRAASRDRGGLPEHCGRGHADRPRPQRHEDVGPVQAEHEGHAQQPRGHAPHEPVGHDPVCVDRLCRLPPGDLPRCPQRGQQESR